MKKIFFFLFLALSVMGCKDDFSISSLPDTPSKLVVYCMPSASDTTFITVSRSIPLKNHQGGQKNPVVDGAAISYQLNGQAQAVEALGNGLYRVVAQQKAGDKVQLRVEAQGLEAVEASTEVPQTVAVSSLSLRKMGSKNGRKQQQLLATFTDPALTQDYYAVRVRCKELQYCFVECFRRYGDGRMYQDRVFRYGEYMQRRDNEQWDSISVEYYLTDTYVPVYTDSEPLLNPLSDIDDDFDFSNDFYQNFYIFEDKRINGTTYTLHLDVEDRSGGRAEPKEAMDELKAKYGIEDGLVLEFYHIAPAYYRFLHALNEVSNNSLAQAGLSPIRPTYSNMRNGLGICAGFNRLTTAAVPWGN